MWKRDTRELIREFIGLRFKTGPIDDGSLAAQPPGLAVHGVSCSFANSEPTELTPKSIPNFCW